MESLSQINFMCNSLENNQEWLRAILSVTDVGMSLLVVKSLCCWVVLTHCLWARCCSRSSPVTCGWMKMKKQWRSWVLGRHSPTVPDHYHSSWISSLCISRAMLEKERQHLIDQHDIVQAGWKLDIDDCHGSTSCFSEWVLKAKTGFGRAGFSLVVKGLKKKKKVPSHSAPPPPPKRKALLIEAQLEMTGLHWQAATPRKSWTDFPTITHMSKHCENTVWPGRS